MADTGLPDDRISYDSETETYSISVEDCSAETVSMCIVRLLAAAEGVQPPDLEPLYESVDPEAVDALFESYAGGSDATAHLTFTYAGYRVRVDIAEGRVTAVSQD